MIDEKRITLNEVLNDGSTIFFYHDEGLNLYKTYGFSAYLLSQIANMRFVSEFSSSMQMPCVSISDVEFSSLSSSVSRPIRSSDGSYAIKTASTVDEDQYRIWVISLKLKHMTFELEHYSSDSKVGLSAFVALSKVNISMYRLVSGYGLDDLLGTDRYYREKGRELFNHLEEKLRIARTITNRARIILAMYHLNHETSVVYDQDHDETCNTATERLFDGALSGIMPLSDLESALLCQCVAHYLYYIQDYDGRQQKMRAFFDKNISSWMSCDWICDMAPRVTLARIQALVCNSDMFMDTRYDEKISVMTEYMCKKMELLTDDDKFGLYSMVSDQGSAAYMHPYAERLSRYDYPSLSIYESLYPKIDNMCRMIESFY